MASLYSRIPYDSSSSSAQTTAPKTQEVTTAERTASTQASTSAASQRAEMKAAPATTQPTSGGAPTLPSASLHPGATNQNVTQDNIQSTICTKGFTKPIRPPEQYTSDLKKQQLRDEGLPGNPSDYEEDHLISLELGGDPKDPKNLWPEPWEKKGSKLSAPGTGAESKDKVENQTNRLVCSGKMSLSDAQTRIASDWHQLGVDEGAL